MDPQEVRGEGLRVREDPKSKVLYPFKPLNRYSGVPPYYTLISYGSVEIFWILEVHEAKRVRTSVLEDIMTGIILTLNFSIFCQTDCKHI